MPGTLLIGFRAAGGGYTVVSAANPLPVTGGGGGGGGDVNLTQINGAATAVGAGNVTSGTQRVVIATDQAAVPVSLATLPALIAGSAIIGKVGIDQTTGGTTNGVVLKSSGGTEVSFADPTTGTGSQVASSASAGTILAANTSRKGATVFNDSTQVLYLILSNTTPTSAVYTVKMAAAGFYEVPFGYNGIIKGIWASANGNAVVTELT